MTAPTSQPGTGWTITGQQEESKLGPGNELQEGVRIYFRTQYGATNSVWLPKINYTVQAVRSAVGELAQTMDAAHQLTG